MKFEDIKDLMQKPEPKADTYEAGMAQNQLLKIGTHAIKIHNMLDNDAEMESWVAKKIDLASNYVKSVHSYTAGSKAGTYDDDGMSEGTDTTATDKEIKMAKGIAFDKRNKDNMSKATSTIEKVRKGLSKQPDVADALRTANEDTGDEAMAKEIAELYDNVLEWITDTENAETDDEAEYGDGYTDTDYNDATDLAKTFREKGMQAGLKLHKELLAKRKGDGFSSFSEWDPLSPETELNYAAKKILARQKESAVQEDAGEGHMSKSQLYATAKMAIELIDMINKGDDLEGWVQTKLNLAADYLQAVYHYEDYQKLNPYREDLDGALMQKHAGVIQKSLDGILARETEIADVDTKPGMMRILKKRVNEVEKDIAKENRKNTDEGGMPASVIKSKQKYANMSDEELADRFKGADEKTLRQMAWRHGYGNMSSHYLDRVKNVMTGKKTATTEAELEEGIKDWAQKLAAAGVIVGAVAGMGSINNAIDNSVPAVKALNTAYELAVDQGHTELAKDIKDDLSAVKIRLSSGKDLNFVKDIQLKYSKFVDAGGLAYESKLAVQLNQLLK